MNKIFRISKRATSNKSKTKLIKQRVNNIIAASALVCLIGTMLGANTYYVASDGNDSRTAAQAKVITTPWATVGRFLGMGTVSYDEGSTYPEQLADGDICYVKTGTIVESEIYGDGLNTCWFLSSGMPLGTVYVQGYASTPGDTPTVAQYPTISGSTTYGVLTDDSFAGDCYLSMKYLNFSAKTSVFYYSASAEGSLIVDHCAFTPKANGKILAGATAGAGLFRTFSITDCNLPWTTILQPGSQFDAKGFYTLAFTRVNALYDPNALHTFIALDKNTQDITITDCNVQYGSVFVSSVDPNNVNQTRNFICTGTHVSMPKYCSTAGMFQLAGYFTQSITNSGFTGGTDPNSTIMYWGGYQGANTINDCTFTAPIGILTSGLNTVLKKFTNIYFTALRDSFTCSTFAINLRCQFPGADVEDCNFAGSYDFVRGQFVIGFGCSPYDPNYNQCVPNGKFLRNTLNYDPGPTTQGMHGVFWSTMSNYWEVAYNKLYEQRNATDPNMGGPGFVIKNARSNFHNNVIYCGNPMSIQGSNDNLIVNNTLVTNGQGTSKYPFKILHTSQADNAFATLDPNWLYPRNNIIEWNIADATKGVYAFRDEYSSVAADDWFNRINHNTYVCGSSGLANIQANDVDDLTTLKTLWAHQTLGAGSDPVSSKYPYNDSMSTVVTDIKFKDPNNLDFTLAIDSTCYDPNNPMAETIGAFPKTKATVGGWIKFR